MTYTLVVPDNVRRQNSNSGKRHQNAGIHQGMRRDRECDRIGIGERHGGRSLCGRRGTNQIRNDRGVSQERRLHGGHPLGRWRGHSEQWTIVPIQIQGIEAVGHRSGRDRLRGRGLQSEED